MKKFSVLVHRNLIESWMRGGARHCFEVLDGIQSGSRLTGVDSEDFGTVYRYWFEHDDDNAETPLNDTVTMRSIQ